MPKKLCETFKLIAENGGDDLYNGTLAKILIEDLKEAGSIIEASDLVNYEYASLIILMQFNCDLM